jgi:hypothetical protein
MNTPSWANIGVWNGNTRRPLRKFSYLSHQQERRSSHIFWDSQVPILEHYDKQDVAINSALCSEMLCDKLKLTIPSECRGQLSQCVVLFVDNSHPHTVAHTVQTLQHLLSEVLGHPPCTVGLSLLWIPQKCFKRLSFCHQPRA